MRNALDRINKKILRTYEGEHKMCAEHEYIFNKYKNELNLNVSPSEEWIKYKVREFQLDIGELRARAREYYGEYALRADRRYPVLQASLSLIPAPEYVRCDSSFYHCTNPICEIGVLPFTCRVCVCGSPVAPAPATGPDDYQFIITSEIAHRLKFVGVQVPTWHGLHVWNYFGLWGNTPIRELHKLVYRLPHIKCEIVKDNLPEWC